MPLAQLRHIDPRRCTGLPFAVWAAADQVRVEVFTLISGLFQRGATQFFRQLGPGPSMAPTRRPVRVQSGRDFAALDHVDDHTAVLRTLIEEFGGEAVVSALRWRLARLLTCKEAKSDRWVRGILAELERSGALSLEKVNGGEVIARIQPVGVTRAYNLPAESRLGPNVTT